MTRINRIAFEGVQSRDLSRHLRANGCKVVAAEVVGAHLIVRSDKSAEQLKELAMQLKGCNVVIAAC